MYRRRSGLSQDEVAFLLGAMYGTTVSRHEHDWRTPTLAAALAYELIFGTPARHLYPKEFERIEKIVQSRARKMMARMRYQPAGVRRALRVALLKRILQPRNIDSKAPLP
jgi:DNA-binding XRE family transcriptional regulator